MLVIRATPADRDGAVAEMVEDAELSGRQYVIEATLGSREVLYGVSVFARRPGVDAISILDRFPGAPAYLEVEVRALRTAGFEVHPTGMNTDHFDIQLIAGSLEDGREASTAELEAAATRVLGVAGRLQPNSAYAGGTAAPQEDR